ncbi:MAG: metallophosphoesterase [Thermodesulfovibrio sp.]|jgi:putative phosphoesterase|uniref:Phosphoesterase n=1 Tax=Thermodesulfovibrio obliviosus TaxID=3118332 RepID=A0AAU8H230_9BACT
MKIGIISDTHDHMENIRKALKIFKENNVKAIIHAGDFVSPFTWRVFKDFEGEFYGVFGNNDGDKVLLKKMYGERIQPQIRELEIEGKKIALMHEPQTIEALAQSGRFNLIVYGHMHEVDIRRVNNTLIINPGEACGWLYGKATVVVLDLDSLEPAVISL